MHGTIMPNRRRPSIPDKTKETVAAYRRGLQDGYAYRGAKKDMLRKLVASIPKSKIWGTG